MSHRLTTPGQRPPSSPPSNPLSRLRRRAAQGIAGASVASVVVTGCTVQADPGVTTVTDGGADSSADVYDDSVVHSVAVEIDDDAYTAMLETYQESGDKEWISGTVTIDGETFQNVGLRLKGNSSLRSVDTSAAPTDLPWLIDLDKNVDGQALDGWTEFVVRSNSTETALNESVALALLEEAGLAGEHAVATGFSVNGAEEELRLVVQNLDDDWDEERFDTEGVLYKAESGGDYSYRGEDPEDYAEVFDQETDKDDEDLSPLIDFLQFVNESSDAEFADQLADRLDVEAFATYLAFEDLIDNFDDIDGPGNNSYLRYDGASGSFTVVAWDHNLAFGASPQGGQDGGGRAGGGPAGQVGGDGAQPPDGMEPPQGMERPEGGADMPAGADGGGFGGAGGGSNILVERFTTNAELNELYEQATTELQASLFESGAAQEVLDSWATLLTDEAGDLVDAATVEEEAAAIAEYFDEK
ncbi:CotH kinase family protein [Antribacter sp. KLBMP9083]|uniref:CotH kinase family protein n=1 Tax=Antribacter soli TaxID=2910976 RepID=A0AA41U8V8_9MICO|nr:CotH kinase family protein [Antribacter soli]MCF4123388.1 CotH kinase family protein [Antribacter soli]